MSAMRVMRGLTLGAISLAMLGACSNQPNRQVSGLSIAKGIFAPGKPVKAPTQQEAVAEIARALAATDAPLIMFSAPARRATAVMQQIEVNGAYRVYGTPDRRSVTLRGGMMTATRGLGNDLMSTDLDAVQALVSGRQTGRATRVMRYLDGEDLTLAKATTCTVTVGGVSQLRVAEIDARVTHMREACTGLLASFTNTYEVASDGTILKSRQWHSPLNQYLTFYALR